MTILWAMFGIFLALAMICFVVQDDFFVVVLVVAFAFFVVALLGTALSLLGLATWQ